MGDKLSTEDILAGIRGGAAPADKPAAGKPAEAEASVESEAPAAAVAAPAPAAGGNILDSIRSGGAAKPAGGAAPKGAGDIMSAIRGGAGAAPAAKKTPAAKAAVPAIDEAAVSGLSVTELIKAARAGQSPEDAEVKPVKLPSKPLKGKVVVKPTAKKKGSEPDRRNVLAFLLGAVLSPVIIAWTAFSSALGIASLGIARFMMPNVLVEPPTKFKIGPPTDYSPGTVSKAQFGVWIVNAEVEGVPMVYALSTVCTHLGCTPNWLEGEQKFKCPCHGSGFRKNGFNFEGPAPRPLERMGIRLAPDGMLEVDKSVKFQQELGQWENAASYVPVV